MNEKKEYKKLLKMIEERKRLIKENPNILVSNLNLVNNNKILKWKSELI